MADTTPRFRFTTFTEALDRLDYQNWKFTAADRVLLDRLLRHAVEAHVHDGASVAGMTPAPLGVELMTDRGAIAPNATVYYRYTFVDWRGQETIGSVADPVTTPAQVPSPTYGPRLSLEPGTMPGGTYLYALTAGTIDSGQETLIGPTAAGTIDNLGAWRLDLPPLPSGAEFFNIYRKGPRDSDLRYLTSTDTFEDRFLVDVGELEPDPHRGVPSANTTCLTNSVTVIVGVPPSGGVWSWKLYRTYDPANWETSFLVWNPHNVTRYTDNGGPTQAGLPPDSTGAVGGAPPVDLTHETTGTLVATATAWSRLVNFNAAELHVGPGAWSWHNDYEHIELVAMRAALGRGHPPAIGPVTVGLDYDTGNGWTAIVDWYSQPIVCQIDTGDTISAPRAFDSIQSVCIFDAGTRLRLHIWETDTAAIPTAGELSVTVTFRARDGNATTSYEWETT